MATVGFVINQFTYRGTEQAIYGYCTGLSARGHKPVLLHWDRPTNSPDANYSCRKRFEQWEIREWTTSANVHEAFASLDLIYVICSGHPSRESDVRNLTEFLPSQGYPKKHFDVPVAYHFVFQAQRVHLGAVVSESVPNGYDIPVLHHALLMNTTLEPLAARKQMREYLGVPMNATLITKLGGADVFNIEPVLSCMETALEERDDLYFAFATTPTIVRSHPVLGSHRRVILCKPITDDVTKAAFIHASDGMIHASQHGETFGLSVLEYLRFGKPVLSFLPDPDYKIRYSPRWQHYHFSPSVNQHLIHLKAAGNLFRPYSNSAQLVQALVRWENNDIQLVYNNPLYSLEHITTQFENLFLKCLPAKPTPNSSGGSNN